MLHFVWIPVREGEGCLPGAAEDSQVLSRTSSSVTSLFAVADVQTSHISSEPYTLNTVD